MVGLLANCDTHFGTKDLYEILSITKAAKGKEIKKAYYKLSMRIHPDRVVEKEKEIATEKFQILGKVYSILSCDKKRAVYDESGEVDDEDDILLQDKDWNAYWRLIFKSISEKDIEQFKKEYQGSEEELEDLKSIYEDCKGDMDIILEKMLCSTIDDEPRYKEILLECIEEKTVKSYLAFTKEAKAKQAKRQKKYEKEAKEAEELKQKMGSKYSGDLASMIQLNQASREKKVDGFLSQLEAKYCQEPKKKKAKTDTGNVNGASKSKKPAAKTKKGSK